MTYLFATESRLMKNQGHVCGLYNDIYIMDFLDLIFAKKIFCFVTFNKCTGRVVEYNCSACRSILHTHLEIDSFKGIFLSKNGCVNLLTAS